MASHQLAIAKASFSAGLLRPDPTSVSRDSIEQFHTLLNSTILQCSPKNVQKCKHWILDNVVRSAARFTSLGKYLNALAASFTTPADGKEVHEPSAKRKRLHILYLVNDILHHGKVYSRDVSIMGKVQPMLMGLVGSAASFKDCPKHQRKIRDLLGIWEEKDYYGSGYVDKLRETANNAPENGDNVVNATTSGANEETSTAKSTKSAPYVMPASHGDASTPWFDLPAANLMPHIIPNSTKPINPDMIRPLKFVAGPADESLVTAVKSLLDDVEMMFGETNRNEKDSWDIDELGQSVVVDEITGDVIGGEGYFGWSRSFCDKMKRRKKGLDLPEQDDGRGRDSRSQSRSRSRSRSSSRGVRKRRHSESGDDSSQERYRSRRRRRDSSSRSRTPERNSGRNSRSRYSSPRRSPTPPRTVNPYHKEPNLPPNQYQGMPYQPPPPPQMPYQQHGFNPNFPPPPPPTVPYNNTQNYNAQVYNGQNPQFGSWPVPPPPPPPQVNFNPSQPWPPPPPPGNPPLNYQQNHVPQQQFPTYPQAGHPQSGPGNWQQQGDGRGYNNGGGWNNGPPNRGRGNFRGRGRGW